MQKIVLIGCGNVGFHLGQRLVEKGQNVVQVFSRTKKKAKRLASIIQTDFSVKINDIRNDGDVYILAVTDNAIEKVARQISEIHVEKALVVHTSGATPSIVLKPYFKNYGNFYPLQTFSVSRKPDFENIPFCIDANKKANRQKLFKLAKLLSPNVYEINDEQRAVLHVAAVIVNNFTNHLFVIGKTICEKENLPFDLLRPLIKETAEKIQQHNPEAMQTGPAIRKDQNTIDRHLDYLQKIPDYQQLYKLLSQSIQNHKFSS